MIVAWHFLPLLLAWARDRRRFLLFGRPRRVAPETHRRRAEVLLGSLLTLGPTFIKLGQLLSTRPDALPPAYIDVLSALQDEVPPAEWEEARVVLEDELGPIEEHFLEFDTDAISGASLGQVYRATLDPDGVAFAEASDRSAEDGDDDTSGSTGDDGGIDVAVKVRRPGIETLVAADLRVIRWSIPILLWFVDDARAFSLESLAEEFDKTIREEMDYVREATMLEEIKANFADDDRFRIPAVIESHSGPRVLTMEYVDGTKITDVDELDRKGIDRERVAENLQRSYLQMIVDDGVFHADPHPGNLAVADDGAIVFYDFGMSGRVDSFVQGKIVAFYVAVANRDIDAILDTLIEIGTLSPAADRAVMAEVMELAIADARGEDIEQYRVQGIIGQIEDSIYDFPFRLPKNLALVLRVATVVEGVCVTLDQDYDFISTATTYLTEEGYREETVKKALADAGDDLLEAGEAMVRVPPKLEATLDRIDREAMTVQVELQDPERLFADLAKRLVYGLLLSVGLISTAIIYAFRGPDLAFVVSGGLSLVVVLLLYRSFRGGRSRIRTTPQFTRQNLRRRQRRE